MAARSARAAACSTTPMPLPRQRARSVAGSRPDTDAGAGEPRPVEEFARVGLAVRRDIRMPDDAVRRDRVARDDLAAKVLDRCHLFCWKRAITPLVAGIDDLDPDRDGVKVPLARPTGATSVKCPPRFGNEPPYRPILLDDVVGADPRRGIAQPLDRRPTRSSCRYNAAPACRSAPARRARPWFGEGRSRTLSRVMPAAPRPLPAGHRRR